MPLSKHFGGNGAEVMANMVKEYGDAKKAKRIFYATENKQKSALDHHIGKTIKSIRRKHRVSRAVEK